MALRDHKKRIWIPEPGTPMCSANERTREPGATCPPPLRRRVPPPAPDRGRQAAGPGEVAPVLRRVRRTVLGRVLRPPGIESAHRRRLSPQDLIWQALYRDEAQRLHRDIALRQLEGI